MSLFNKATALERRIKLKPTDISFLVNISPCYECEGCEKCQAYHERLGGHPGGIVITVDGEDYD